jgi:chloride channel protein, CIC family
MTGLANERQRRLVMDALLLGIVGALAARAFSWLIPLSRKVFLEGIAGYVPPGLPGEGGALHQTIGSHGLWLIPFVTTLGGLIVGLLLYFAMPEARGHGTNAVVRAFHQRSGFIRARVAPLELIAASVTLGSGGACGREGPITLISGSLGSTYAALRHRSDEERRLLVLIGMTAGLSAIFRTPIGAAVFAIEVLYSDMEFETDVLLYAILASVTAYTLNGMLVGWDAVFEIPLKLSINAPGYLEFALLGILGGVVATALPLLYHQTHHAFERLRVPLYAKPALGGLGVGLIALAYPQVLAGGYGWMQMAINGDLTLKLMLALVVAKMIAMSFTLGSGGAGGDFAPTLFVGAMLGGVLADVFDQSSAAFAVVGMAAVFSGAARVPFATLFMVTEMTGGYQLLVPAALVVALSYLVQDTLSSRFEHQSLYTSQVPRRVSRDVDLLEGVRVEEAMSPVLDTVSCDVPVKALIQKFEKTHHHGFIVVDAQDRLEGIVTVGDLEKAMLSGGDLEQQSVCVVATRDGLAVAYPDETLGAALWRMGVRQVGRLPVVERQDDRRLVGILRRSDVIDAYEQAMARRADISYRLKELREAHQGHVYVVETNLASQHAFIGKTVQDIARDLPRDCILVSVQRGPQVIIPHGGTVLQEGDRVVVLASENCRDETERILKSV